MARLPKWVPPAFVPLLAAYPVIYLATANPGQAKWATVAAVTIAAVLAAMIAFGLIRLVARSAISAGVATVLVVVMFFSYGQFVTWLDAFMVSLRLGDEQTPNILDSAPNVRLAIALAWGALALTGAWFLARAYWPSKPELGKAMTFAAMLLLAGSLVMNVAQRARTGNDETVAVNGGMSVVEGQSSNPDVYFIVLDGYARQDVLARYYGYDNAPFLDALSRRGFRRFPTAGSTNYTWTFLSLASTLNMRYLQPTCSTGAGAEKARTGRSCTRPSATTTWRDFCESRGYGSCTSGPPGARRPSIRMPTARCAARAACTTTSSCGASRSPAGSVLSTPRPGSIWRTATWPTSRHCERRLSAKTQVRLCAFRPAASSLSVRQDGRILRNAVVSNQFEFQKRLWEDRDSYREQLEFVNRKVLETVDGCWRSRAATHHRDRVGPWTRTCQRTQ